MVYKGQFRDDKYKQMLIFIIILLFYPCESFTGAPMQWHNQTVVSRVTYDKAISYITCKQSSFNRSDINAINVGVLGSGGFGSMFQKSAQTLFHYFQSGTKFPVQLLGEYRKYSDVHVCTENKPAGLLNCFFQDLVIDQNSSSPFTDCNIYDPGIEFRGFNWDSPWWWGVIQSYMFRPNSLLTNAFLIKTGLKEKMIFDFSVHIRIGGKKERPKQFLKRGVQFEVETYLNSTLLLIEKCRKVNRLFNIYIASDSPEARPFITKWATVHNQILNVFIQDEGTTQKHAAGGREAFRKVDSDLDRLNLSFEILTDIWFCSRSNVFIGICMSQLARMIVGIGMSNGLMSTAVAMDPEMIQKNSTRVFKFGTEEGFRSIEDCIKQDTCSED